MRIKGWINSPSIEVNTFKEPSELYLCKGTRKLALEFAAGILYLFNLQDAYTIKMKCFY